MNECAIRRRVTPTGRFASRVFIVLCALFLVFAKAAIAQDFPSVQTVTFQPRVRVALDSMGADSDTQHFTGRTRFGSARVGMAGRLGPAAYLLEYELRSKLNSGGEAQLRYASLSVGGREGPFMVLGQTDEPFGLEAFTSYRHLSFLERALPFALVPLYHTGAVVGTTWGNGGVSLGVFGETVGQANHDEGQGFSARAFTSPVHAQDHVLHLGAAVARRMPRSHEMRVSTRPELGITDVRLLDTGRITNASSANSFALEAAYVRGSFSAQAEVISTAVRRSADDARFSGAYLSASFFPTGETRRFDSRRGSFTGIGVPRSSAGAVELLARVSYLDLNSGPILGGRETNYTAGLNYYFSDDVRLMFNYIHVSSTRRGIADNPRLFAMRLQAGF